MRWSELPTEYRDLDIPEKARNYGGYNFEIDDLNDKFHWFQSNEGHDFWRQCCESKTIDELPPLPNKEFILPEKWCVKMKDPITDRNVYFHNPSLMGNHYFSGVMDSYDYTEITYDQWVKYVRDTDTKFYGGLEHIDSVNYKYKENALKQNNNLEKIKEMRDVVNDKEKKNEKVTSILDYVTNNLNIIKEIKETMKSFEKGGEVAGVKLDSGEKIVPQEQQEKIGCRSLEQLKEEILVPFYMIYVDGASGSTRRHDYKSACKEAQRLSKETDKKVFILRSVEYFERNIEIKNTILK